MLLRLHLWVCQREKIKRSAKLEADRVAYRKRILQEDETTVSE